ncbi:hypothetical protein [Lignipirellula cremea]|uniref:Zinc-finger domain-containing protein n=1 Tax=Lignipirellula cremea TaxID=2528010 RepID=A0A518DZT0_9BACT|nr:hypothetical protein [Lignipirellula cremea]QDU97344.1 hypothetical protein Pla8534_51900 [Lignipirellula cremea]
MTKSSSEKHATPDREQDLPWQAFCYVAEELDGESRTAFEERLAVDQQAREAVAAAVELHSALQAVVGSQATVCSLPAAASTGKSQPTGRTRQRTGRQVGFLAAAACLTIVGLVGYVWLAGWQAEIAGRSVDDPGSLRFAEAENSWPQLALAWSAAREEVFTNEAELDWASDDDAWEQTFPLIATDGSPQLAVSDGQLSVPQAGGEGDAADDGLLDDELASDSLEVPSWMLAALAGAAANASPEMEN